MIYKLYEEANGGNVSVTELEEKIIKVGYFEPKLSATRLIGNAYIDEDKAIDVGMDIFDRGLCLPSDIKMTKQEQDLVIKVIRSCFGK